MKKLTCLLVASLCVSIQVSAQLYESFEGATFPPTGWTTFIGTNNAGTSYNWTTSTSYSTDGAQSAFVRWENSGLVNEDWLVTPLLNLSGTGNALTFDGRDEYQPTNYGSVYYIMASTLSQTNITDFDTVAIFSENDMGPGFQSFNISLSAYDGLNVYIAFMMTNNNGDSWAIDNVFIGTPITCAMPDSLSALNITQVSADLDWVSMGSGTDWQVEYGPTGFSIGAGTRIDTSATAYSLAGLTPLTTYDVYYREICGTGDTSLWRGPVSFTTLIACPEPTNPGLSELTSSQAEVYWNGGGNTSWIMEWGPLGYHTATGMGPSGTIYTNNDTVLITGLNASSNYEFRVATDCSSQGFGISDSTYHVPFTTTCAPLSLPYTENFSGGFGCSSVLIGGNSLDTWEILLSYNSPSETLDGTQFAMINSDAAGSGVNMNDYLTTPVIDASGIAGDLFLDFDQYFRPWSSGGEEKGEVEVWDGSQWHVVLSMADSVGNQGSWGNPDHRIIDITAFANDSLQVRFHYYETDWDYYWAIDNIRIRDVNCIDPVSLATLATGIDSITINWDRENGISWNLLVDTTGFTPNFSTAITVADTFHTFTGLNSSTSYDIYIQAECSLSQLSDWVGPVTVMTECDTFSLPWIEGFETISPGELPLCVTRTGNQWITATASNTFNRSANNGDGYVYASWNTDEWLFSPEFFLEASKSYTFSFWYITDGNSGWDFTEPSLSRVADSDSALYAIGQPLLSPVNTAYQQYTTSFSPLVDGNYTIGTHLISNSSPWYMSFDDFELVENSSCETPQPILVSGITSQSIDIEWGSIGMEWELEWGANGFMPGVNIGTTVTGISNTTYTLSGLPSDSCLTFYLRSICGTDTSAWGGPQNFCTEPTCPAPTMLGVESVAANSATIYWTTGGAGDWNVVYGPAGITPGTGTHIAATNDTIVISGLQHSTNYQFYVRDSCAANDHSVWVGPYTFTTECLVVSLPYSENFDFTLGCFNIQIGGSSSETWKWMYDRNGQTLGGSNGFMLIDSELAGSTNTQNDYSVTPYIDASGIPATDSLILSFNQYFYDWLLGNDSAKVDVWDGTQWVNVLTQAGASVGSWSVPDKQIINITSYANDSLQVRFHYKGAYDWYWAVDEVYIGIGPECAESTNISADSIGCDSAIINWTAANSGSTIILEYDTAGFTPGTGTLMAGVANPYILTGLAPGRSYDVYLREICTFGDTSNLSPVLSFQTNNGPLPVVAFSWQQTDTTATSGTVSFDASSTTGATGITWDFGGTPVSGAIASHLYSSNGIYNVTITASNECGSIDSVFQVELFGISIDELNAHDQLLLYPNPTSGIITLQLTGNGGESAILNVKNTVGQLIYHEEIDRLPDHFERVINLTDMASGLYLIEWQYSSGIIIRRVIRN